VTNSGGGGGGVDDDEKVVFGRWGRGAVVVRRSVGPVRERRRIIIIVPLHLPPSSTEFTSALRRLCTPSGFVPVAPPPHTSRRAQRGCGSDHGVYAMFK